MSGIRGADSGSWGAVNGVWKTMYGFRATIIGRLVALIGCGDAKSGICLTAFCIWDALRAF